MNIIISKNAPINRNKLIGAIVSSFLLILDFQLEIIEKIKVEIIKIFITI
jgi:hypothetical protein